MSNQAEPLRNDRIFEVLEERQSSELRFRSALITSTAAHVGATVAVLVAPLFVPKPVLFELTPVSLVSVQEAPQSEPAPAPEQTPAAAPVAPPEPEPVVQDVPKDLEAQRRKEAAAEARRREEEAARRKAAEEARKKEEEERRRQAELERLRQEEEARRQAPQTAARSDREAPPQEQITQQTARGAVGGQFTDPTTNRTVTDLPQYWLDRLMSNIRLKWDPPPRPLGSRERLTLVHFVVGRDGSIIAGPDVRTGSGDSRYDEAAIRAIRAGQPFPPLPQAYSGRSLGINLAFRQDQDPVPS